MVAQGVVECLEPVYVNKHQRALGLRCRALGQHLLQPVHQQQPVGQARQRVIKRQLVDGVGGCLALGDVAAYGHPVHPLACGGHHLNDFQFKPEATAVLAVNHQFAARLPSALEGRRDAFEFACRGRRTKQLARCLSQHVLAAIASLLLEGLVDEDDIRHLLVARHGLGNEHDVVESGNAGFQQHQLLLRFAPGADVPQVHRQPFGKRVGTQFQPFSQSRVKGLKFNPALGGNGFLQLHSQVLLLVADQHSPHLFTHQFMRAVE